MSFDRDALEDAIRAHGRVARVVVAQTRGSVPREVGAAMLVWKEGDRLVQSGTIGGGALEFEAANAAFDAHRLTQVPLGPARGQCCGGAVTLLTEVFDSTDVIPDDIYVRGRGDMPFSVRKHLHDARAQGQLRPQLIDDWMIEPLTRPTREIWIWGAGHVGRALVHVLAPFADMNLTWIDTDLSRFPHEIPDGVTQVTAQNPADLVPHAPPFAEHLVLTYSHNLDLALCHSLLTHGFSQLGLIGSKTKWARFRSRLQGLGHNDAQISRICCPIGQPELGKAPQAIAVGVAASLLSSQGNTDSLSGNGMTAQDEQTSKRTGDGAV